jgi:sortase A
MSRGVHAKRRGCQVASALLAVAGLVLVGVAATLVIHVSGFYARSRTVGGALIARERAAIADTIARASWPGPAATDTLCPAPQRSLQRPEALLKIPAIHLTAPVLQGDSDSVLAVAVGHDPASSWQAGAGTVVLDAHDVTWFHDLPRLHPGDMISIVNPCEAVRYRVLNALVEPAGTRVTNRPGRLVLVTCYPLDALFYTSERYVLTATEIGVPTETNARRSAQVPSPIAVPNSGVPPSWVGVSTLAANPTIPVGSLLVDGRPAAVWSQSPAPLDAAAAVQKAFFASLREGENSTTIWSRLHPGVSLSGAVTALAGTEVVSSIAAMQTSLAVEGSTVRAATITDGVVLSNGIQLRLIGTFEVSGAHGGSAGSFRLVNWIDG